MSAVVPGWFLFVMSPYVCVVVRSGCGVVSVLICFLVDCFYFEMETRVVGLAVLAQGHSMRELTNELTNKQIITDSPKHSLTN